MPAQEGESELNQLTTRRRARWNFLPFPGILAVAALLVGLAPTGAAAQTSERCFTETGSCISGRIREFWEQNGGLSVFGLPLGAQHDVQIEGKTYQAQQFERTRLELHPENARPYDVLLGRLGADTLAQQGRDWFTFPKSEAKAGCRFFPETGHNVCGDILKAWRASGLEFDSKNGKSEAENLALFGLPLSGEMTEMVEGKEYTVQWFERARFELHPENQPPYNVLLGRLNAEMEASGSRFVLPGNTVFPEGVAYQASNGNFYVSSTTDGTIFRANVKSNAAAQTFLPGGSDGRTSATGMKVDSKGRLFISGGATGQMFVYNTADGALLGKFNGLRQPTFINDVTVVPNGDAFFTDSQSPVLYRIYTAPDGKPASEDWLDLNGTAIQYQQGFNLNGIASTADGAYLIVVQSNTGKLFRISTSTKEVMEISLGGQTVTNGDGILLDGQTLYVVRNQNGVIVKITLANDFASGTVVSSTSNELFAYPTTIAKADSNLLVVNSQFNKRGDNVKPVLPFTVVSVPAP
jgi:Cu-Zn family superoxide dismutase